MGRVKVQLVTDGGYKGMENIDMSVTYWAWHVVSRHSGKLLGYDILKSDLIKAGAAKDFNKLNDDTEHVAYFSMGTGLFDVEAKACG